MESKLRLWKYHADCGRGGDVHGLFVATQEELGNIIGLECHFGEILGKHSEVSVDLYDDDFKMLDVDTETIKKLIKAVGNDTICGYNPLDYMKNDEEYE
ncbi:MAG: hypothetical protein HQK53_16485 [Oligoflexia bacterium]|nr:hypothetical protein [Oligoflexia bacterium]